MFGLPRIAHAAWPFPGPQISALRNEANLVRGENERLEHELDTRNVNAVIEALKAQITAMESERSVDRTAAADLSRQIENLIAERNDLVRRRRRVVARGGVWWRVVACSGAWWRVVVAVIRSVSVR